MKDFTRASWLICLLLLSACAASDLPAPVVTVTRSAQLAPTLTPTMPAALRTVPTVARAVPTATAAPSARPIVPASPTALPSAARPLPNCPPLPTPTALETRAAVQHFEQGLMFWLEAEREIWVLIDSPIETQFYWRILPDVWSDSQPESDPALQPPAGKFQPVRGFGVAWRMGGGSHSPQRDDLGWAIDEERGFDTTRTYYPQGFYSPDCTWMPKSGIYELTDDRGQVYQFVGAGGIAKRVNNDQ